MDWLAYFKYNCAHRMPVPWEQGISVESQLRLPLIRSLQRFQVGEQGDGAHLIGSAEATGNTVYGETIRLFIGEEQEHARLLARLLRGMDAPLLKRHWSDVCFVLVRRLAGLRLELMVLMVAEMIAKRYYRALYEGTNDPVLGAVFAQILRDELGHVAFHCDYLHSTLTPLPSPVRLLIRWGWRLFFGAVCFVVVYDHRGVLRAVGVSPGAFWRDCGLIFTEAADHIFGSVTSSEETIGQLYHSDDIWTRSMSPAIGVTEEAYIDKSA